MNAWLKLYNIWLVLIQSIILVNVAFCHHLYKGCCKIQDSCVSDLTVSHKKLNHPVGSKPVRGTGPGAGWLRPWGFAGPELFFCYFVIYAIGLDGKESKYYNREG